MNKIKVVVTIGPVSKDKEQIKELILNGADVVRINLSYASHEFCRDVITKVRELNKELGTSVGIMLDLKGPTIKSGRFVGGSAHFTKGDKVRMYMNDTLGDNTKLSVDYPDLICDVRLDNIIKVNDGLVELKVLDKGSDYILCEVITEGNLSNYCNINVPGVDIKLPFLQVQDIKDIEFANDINVDFLSLSFVRNSADVLEVTDMLIEYGNDHMEVISKIECEDAVNNLDDIIKVSNGVMIARGDLSVEVPMERVPAIQKLVIGKCHRMGKISIVSTELLSSMEMSPKPTRAEVSDIANAVLDGTDAVSLTGETTIGAHPIEAVQALERIVSEAELDIDYFNLCEEAERTEDQDITGMIACSVAETADKLKCKAIIIPTVSGYTARKISRFRPRCPIIAVSPNSDTVMSLALHFGVTAVQIDELNSLDKIIKTSEKITRELVEIKSGDKIIITGGYPFKETKTTNFMKIEEL